MNKLAEMSEAEMKLLPYGFLKKYGSYIHFLKRMESDHQLQENKEHKGYFDQVKRLSRLQTDKQKQHKTDRKQSSIGDDDNVEMASLLREEGDYFKRQPRVDMTKQNYNFE